jgi:hypothetical protein
MSSDWVNRIGIILNFCAGFLLAPELTLERGASWKFALGVHAGEAWPHNRRGIEPLCVPSLYALLKDFEMRLVCHMT